MTMTTYQNLTVWTDPKNIARMNVSWARRKQVYKLHIL